MPENRVNTTTTEDHFEKVLAELLQGEENGKPFDLEMAVR